MIYSLKRNYQVTTAAIVILLILCQILNGLYYCDEEKAEKPESMNIKNRNNIRDRGHLNTNTRRKISQVNVPSPFTIQKGLEKHWHEHERQKQRVESALTLFQQIYSTSVEENTNRSHLINTSRSIETKISVLTKRFTNTTKYLNKERELYALTSTIDPCRHTPWFGHVNLCQRHLQWEKRNLDKLQRTSVEHSLVKVYIGDKQDMPNMLHVITYTVDNKKKIIGGDYFRTFLVEKSKKFKMNVNLFDFNNGEYSGVFYVPEPGNYELHIILEYSVCEGMTDPPKNWFRKGSIQGKFQPEGTIGRIDSFLNIPFPVREFRIKHNAKAILNSNVTNTEIDSVKNNNCGYWIGGQYRPYRLRNDFKKQPRQTKLDTLVVYGDSLGYRFYNSIHKKFCKDLFEKCKNIYTWTYKLVGTSQTRYHRDKTEITGDDFSETRLFNEIKTELVKSDVLTARSVFLINFGLHQVSTMNLSRAFNLFDGFLNMLNAVRRKNKKIFPLVVWKTTTPPVIENVKTKNKTCFRFLTKQRIEAWNSYTIQKCHEAGIPVIDVWDQAISSWFKPIDHVHYENPVFYRTEDDLKSFIIRYFGVLPWRIVE